MKLSFIVPCYNEEKNIPLFFNDVKKSFNNSKYDIEIIFVNDGSKDNTISELKKLLINKQYDIKIVNFSKNFGKEAGIYAGLKASSGDYSVLIDADMQQPPSLVLEMLAAVEKNEEIDIVAYYQEKRIEGKVLSFCKSQFYKIINKITGLDFVNGASDFRLLKRNVVDAILQFSEHNRFSKGIFAYIGFNTHYIPYVPEKRANGTTSWNFKKLFMYAYSGILSFSSNPVKLISKIANFTLVFSIIYLIILIIFSSLNSFHSIICFILFMFGINFKIISFLGEFVYRGYDESRNRPIYIVKEVISNEKNN